MTYAVAAVKPPMRPVTVAPAPQSTPVAPAPSVAVNADELVLSADMPRAAYRRLTVEEKIREAERLMGKPVRFKDEAERKAYIQGLEQGLAQDAYDPQGFLAMLGITGVLSGGRTDKGVLNTVRAIPDYRPTTQSNGEEIWIQQRAFDFATANPRMFLALARLANPIIEAPAQLEGEWKKPLQMKQTPVPTQEQARERYREALEKTAKFNGRFGDDFHNGLEPIPGGAQRNYGTVPIAKALGFSAETAQRLGAMSKGVDDNTTPYGKTGPSPFHAIGRHFNLDRDAQDTRLVYAAQHLAAAIQLAEVGSFKEAEIELGVGLHALQDVFAHGQISPAMHAVVGEFPDEVDLHPMALYEATRATAAYLVAYLEAITQPGRSE